MKGMILLAINYSMLGKRIRMFREKTKASQEKFAEQLDISREYMNLIENGSRHPSADTIVAIANLLGTTPNDLLIDSLTHISSTADAELDMILVDATDREREIALRLVKELIMILYSIGI